MIYLCPRTARLAVSALFAVALLAPTASSQDERAQLESAVREAVEQSQRAARSEARGEQLNAELKRLRHELGLMTEMVEQLRQQLAQQQTTPPNNGLEEPRDWALQGIGLVEFARQIGRELDTRVVISAAASESAQAGEEFTVNGSQVTAAKHLGSWLQSLYGLAWRRSANGEIRIVVPGEVAKDDPYVRVEGSSGDVDGPGSAEQGFGFTSFGVSTFLDTDDDGLPDTRMADFSHPVIGVWSPQPPADGPAEPAAPPGAVDPFLALDLARQLVAASADIESAEGELERVARLRQQMAVSEHQQRAAGSAMRRAQRERALLEVVAAAELEALELQLHALEALRVPGQDGQPGELPFAFRTREIRLRAGIRVLRRALD